MRNWVLTLNNNCCFFCKCKESKAIRKSLDVHHIDSNVQHNTFDNLLPLCAQCHTMVRRFYNRLLKLSITPDKKILLREFPDFARLEKGETIKKRVRVMSGYRIKVPLSMLAHKRIRKGGKIIATSYYLSTDREKVCKITIEGV